MLDSLNVFIGPVFSPSQLMQNLLACKFVGNSVLVFSEMRAAMESWYINSVCINNKPTPLSPPSSAWPRAGLCSAADLAAAASCTGEHSGGPGSKGHSCYQWLVWAVESQHIWQGTAKYVTQGPNESLRRDTCQGTCHVMFTKSTQSPA